MKRKTTLACLLALALLLGLLSGCGVRTAADPAANGPTAEPTAEPKPGGTDPDRPQVEHRPSFAPVELGETRTAGSYDEVRTLLAEARTSYGYGYYAEDAEIAQAEPAEGWSTVANATEAPTAEAAGRGSGEDYGTNVQVAGIDEADNVKTDGDYLYVATTHGFLILRADGAQTEVVSRVEALQEGDDEYCYVTGLFVRNDRLALLYDYNRWGWTNGEYEDVSCTKLLIYDVSDRTAPVRVTELGQDGSCTGARMNDGVICLITGTWVGYVYDDAEPADYVPCVYNDAGAALLPAERIYLCQEAQEASYTVVGLYALDSAEALDTCAFTDACDTVYMDQDALYLARTVWTEEESGPYTEAQYTVTDHTTQTTTEIKKLGLADGVTLLATGSVPGSLLNQFSLDVYEGNLRVATTINNEAYSVYEDEQYGWSNYRWYDAERNNRVAVLDGALQQIGSLEDLVADEQIYSVRFLGEIGYVVTYESIDPVFAIDFSDPTAPTLLSSLELPGVSQYLHPYGTGRLFGFGQAVDEDAVSGGLQLSMFDVSDPRTVSLEGQTVLPDTYSQALYDHHAILVDAARDLICFPLYDYDEGESAYAIWHYEDGTFTTDGTLALDYYADDARGIALGDYLYICSPSVTYVAALDGMELVAELSEAVG